MISLKEKGILLTKAYEDEIEQEANGKYQLSFKYPTSDDNWTAILSGDLILADDLDGEQEFRIFEVTKRHEYLNIYAEQVADDLNKYSISSINVDRVTGGVVMSNLAGSIVRSHPFSFYSDIDAQHTFNEKNVSAMSALAEGKHSIIGQWSGDLVRDKYRISLLKNGGRDSEALFMYQKNLKAYVETDSIKDLVTRLHLSIKDSDVATTVDSPLIDAYNGRIYESSIEVSDQDVQTVEHLQEYGRNYFAENLVDISSNSLEIAVTDNQEYDVRIFDTVFVHHKVFGKDLRMKITSYKYGPMGRKLRSIGFGKTKANLAQQMSGIASDVSEKAVSVSESNFEQKLRKEIENADRVVDGKFEDLKNEVNDGIEQAKAEAELYADNIKQSIDADINVINQSMQAQSEEHDRQVADILSKTQSIESLANQAKTDAANAITQALQSKDEAIANATAQVATVETKVNQLINEVSSKVSRTDYNTLTGRVSSAETAITQNATEISKRLTSTQVESAITGKGYITNSALQPYALSTTVQNLVNETADSFSRTISETRALIPSGESNLVKFGRPGETSEYVDADIITHPFFYGGGVKLYFIKNTSATNEKIVSFNRFAVERNTEYTLYFKGFNTDSLVDMDVWFLKRVSGSTAIYDNAQLLVGNRKLSTSKCDEVVVTFNTGNFDEGFIRFDNNKSVVEGIPAELYFGDVSVKKGKSNNGWSPSVEELATVTALHAVNDTVDSHTRTIGAVGTTGSILDNVSKVTQTANGLVQEVSGANGLKTQVSTLAGSYAIKNLTKAGDVLGQINLNPDGSVRINEGLISVGTKTYIQDGVISSAKIASLDAGKITTGTLNAARIAVNSIDGSKLVFDQAFFNSFMANEAYLKQVFAKNAFITQVQAVTLSASNVTTGILRATNGALDIDLDNANITFNKSATINFNSDSNALVRKKGDVTAFVNFADDPISGGVYAGIGVTSHNVGVTTASNSDSGKFAGMRVYRPNDNVDLLRLIGDTITLAHGTEGNYFNFKTTELRNNVDMIKLAGAVYTLSRIFIHLRVNGWSFSNPSFIQGVKDEMARNWLDDFAIGGLPR